MKIDLHCHTLASDGQLTPKEIVERAVNMQVDVLAITDHDTVGGLAEAMQTADKLPITIVSGVEISTCWHSFEIHIVGLGFDVNHPAMISLLERQRQARIERAKAISAKLAKKGIEGTYDEVSRSASDEVIGRNHFARLLVRRGLVSDNQAAFDKYLGKGQCAHVRNTWCEPAEAIRAIRSSGGVSVLAHPGKYDLSNKWLRKLITDFADAGGQAMEAIHCQQPPQQQEFLLQLAEQSDLMISAGSDFHAPSPWIELGRNLNRPEQLGVWHHFGWV